MKPYAIYEIEVVDNSFNTIAVIKEKQLEQLILTSKRNMKIGEILWKIN
jgi:hypothetical protein